ncbi:MAG TPA: recombinase RecT [Polyangiales bacterium]|jgi:recombination protein RecT|nr:recombinase RecT [Polyangiales bacterium]
MSTGPQTKPNGEIVKKQADPAGDLRQMLRKMLPEIERALPKHVTPDRMARVATTALTTTKDLALCTIPSFVGCVMQAAQLGLEVNTPLGHAYLIPRKAKNLQPSQRNCTLIIGYQGFIELARRSGMVSSIYAYAVRDGDAFEYELGLEPTLKHKPSEAEDREKKKITHVYAVAKMRDSDERVFVVLTRAQIEARRLRGASASADTPWDTDYEAMALKSAVRALWKWLPKSAEIARATALEDAAESGASQTSVLDPTVADAMTRGGLIDEAEIVAEQQQSGGELQSDTTTVSDDELRRVAQGDKAKPEQQEIK